jgi:hypothetical protein
MKFNLKNIPKFLLVIMFYTINTSFHHGTIFSIQNDFHGASLSYTTIKEFYPKSEGGQYSQNFDHFAFLYVLNNSSADEDNDYYLSAYAVATDGSILNEGKPLKIKKLGQVFEPDELENKKIILANINLSTTILDILYEHNKKSDLGLYPILVAVDPKNHEFAMGLNVQTYEKHKPFSEMGNEKDTSKSSNHYEFLTQQVTTVNINPCPPAKIQTQ